jgi:hypothetical protein
MYHDSKESFEGFQTIHDDFGLNPKFESFEQHVRDIREEKVVRMKYQDNLFTKISPDGSVVNDNFGSIRFDSVDSSSKAP